MKNIITFLTVITTCLISTEINAQTLCHADGPKKTIELEVLSQEDTAQLSGVFSFELKIKAMDSTIIDSFQISISNWFSNYNIGNYSSTMLPNDSQLIIINILYDTNLLSFYPEQISINCYATNVDSQLFNKIELVEIYFTPYNTIEIWNINDFSLLPREWISREFPQPNRVYMSKNSLPISNKPDLDSNSATWESDFEIIYPNNLAYGIQMEAIHPDTMAQILAPNPIAFALYKTFSGTLVGRLRAEVINDLGVPILLPLGGIKIQLREKGIKDNTLTTGVTNVDGTFTLTWDNVVRLGDKINLWLKIFSENEDYDIRVTGERSKNLNEEDDDGMWVVKMTKRLGEFSDNVNINFSSEPNADWIILRNDVNRPFFLLTHWAVNGYRFARNEGGSDILSEKLRIRPFKNSSFYMPSATNLNKGIIRLETSDENHENTIYHEFGHHLMWSLQGKRWLTTIIWEQTHRSTEESNQHLAWTEGWATGVMSMLDAYYHNIDGESRIDAATENVNQRFTRENMEQRDPRWFRNGAGGNGIRNEYHISCAINDLFDGSTSVIDLNPNVTETLPFASWADINTSTIPIDNTGWEVGDQDNVSLTARQIMQPLINTQSGLLLDNVFGYYYALQGVLGSDCDQRKAVKEVFDQNRVNRNVLTFDVVNNNVSSDDIRRPFTLTTWGGPFDAISFVSNTFHDEDEITQADVHFNITGNQNIISDNLSVSNAKLLLLDKVASGWSGSSDAIPSNGSNLLLNICSESLNIQQGAEMRLASNDALTTVEAHLLADALLSFIGTSQSPSILRVNNNSKLTIEEGATLRIGPGTTIILDGPNAILEIKGNLELLDNAVFAPIGGPNGLGFVRFNTAIFDANTAANQMKLGNNSRITFNGINGAKVLEVAAHVLWLDEQSNNFTFELINGKAEMGQNTTINIAGSAKFDHAVVDVLPTATQYNGVYIWYKTPVIKFSTFKHGKTGLNTSTWQNRTIESNTNIFANNNTGWFNIGSGVVVYNSAFTNNANFGLLATGQTLNSKFYTSTISNASQNGILYQGTITSGLTVRSAILTSNLKGIVFESDANLTVGCSKITGLPISLSQLGIVMKNGRLVLNNLGGVWAGRNDITNQMISILLTGKPYLYLNDGYNRLSNKSLASSSELSIWGITYQNSSPLIAHRNRWNEKSTGANPPINGNLPWPVGTFIDYNLIYPISAYSISAMDILDAAPLSLSAFVAATNDCTNPPVQYDPSVGNTNLVINTTRYPNTPINTAIGDVMNRNLDTLVPKSEIVNRYQEILAYDGYELPVNAELDYYLEMANDYMAIALGDWAAEQPLFETGCLQLIPFQEALGVCNYWLTATLADTGFSGTQLRNKVAITKGHILYLAKENILAKNQFLELTNWGDSLAIDQSNFWICQIDRQTILEEQRANFYLIDSLPPCSGTYNYGNQYKRDLSQIKFENKIGYTVYPNPTKDKIFVGVQTEKEMTYIELTLIDLLGNIVKTKKAENIKVGFTKVEMTLDEIAKGTYIMQIKTDDKIENRKVVLMH